LQASRASTPKSLQSQDDRIARKRFFAQPGRRKDENERRLVVIILVIIIVVVYVLIFLFLIVDIVESPHQRQRSLSHNDDYGLSARFDSATLHQLVDRVLDINKQLAPALAQAPDLFGAASPRELDHDERLLVLLFGYVVLTLFSGCRLRCHIHVLRGELLERSSLRQDSEGNRLACFVVSPTTRLDDSRRSFHQPAIAPAAISPIVAAQDLLSKDDVRTHESTRGPLDGTYEDRGLPASAWFFLSYHRFGRFPGALNDRDAVDKLIVHIGTPAAAIAPGCRVSHLRLHFAIPAAAQVDPTITQ
jgi:hypothetical protein